MSLRHLFAGTMVGVFTLACGMDPSRRAPEVAFPGVAVADSGKGGGAAGKGGGKAADDKQAEHAAKEAAREAADKSDNKTDKPRERTWAQRLVFPSGNKF